MIEKNMQKLKDKAPQLLGVLSSRDPNYTEQKVL